MGAPHENRFTAFDTLCSAQSCREQGIPQIYVNTANLNLVVRMIDLHLGSADAGFLVERTWNLDDTYAGPFGNRWSSSLTEGLTIASDQTVTLRRATGHLDRFAPGVSSSTLIPLTLTSDTLVRNSDGTYTLSSPASTTTRVFGADGRIRSIRDGAVTRVAFDYDSSGRLSAARYRGRTVKLTWNAAGRVSSIADAAGRSVSFAYTTDGNLSQQSTADGQILSYSYDAFGNLTGISAGGTVQFTYDVDAPYVSLAGVTLPGGAVRRYDIPNSPREIRVTGGAGDVTLYGSTGLGQVETITDGAGNRTSYVYDAAGRRTRATSAGGEVTRFDYDAAGNLTLVTDAGGNRWSAVYDSAGRRSRTRNPNGNTYQYAYSSDGSLSAVADPAGVTTYLSRSGSMATLTDGVGNRSVYEYDTDNFTVKFTDAANAVRSWTYDGAGRPATMTDSAGSVKAEYDARNRLTAATAGDARLALNYSGVERDLLGRLTRVVDSFGNQLTYDYDASGRLARLTLPGGRAVTYEYDSAGRLGKVADWAGNFALYRYDAAGWPVSLNFSGGPVTVYQYDAVHNLKALISTGPDGTPLAGYRYTLDANGNRTAVSAMEATTATASQNTARLVYDAVGRPTARDDGSRFRYDARGNLVAIEGSNNVTLAWDAFGRLQSLTGAAATLYRYDALGLRVERMSGSTTRRFVYDLSGTAPRVVLETDETNSPLAFFVYGLGLLWKVLPDGRTYFYHTDGDGNVVALSSSAAGIVNRYRYDAFSRLVASEETVENAFRSHGAAGWVDDNNGLVYNGASYWYPELRLYLKGTVDLSPPVPDLLPRVTGGGACLLQGVSECGLAAARRIP